MKLNLRHWIKGALCAGLLAALVAPGLMAQTYTQLPTFGKTPEHWLAQIINANTTASVTVVDCTTAAYACTNLGAKITSIIATTTDTAADTIELSISNGTETAILATISIPGSSGVSTTSLPVNILQLGQIPGLFIDSDGNPVLFITGSQKLIVNATASVASTKAVTLFVQGSVF